jgi:hypothetical protein
MYCSVWQKNLNIFLETADLNFINGLILIIKCIVFFLISTNNQPVYYSDNWVRDIGPGKPLVFKKKSL